MQPSHKSIDQITEHLFRETYQEVFSSMIVKFGAKNIDLVEDALQETFFKALKSWKHDNHPANPKAWLFTVTKNNIINQLRRRAKSVSIPENLESLLPSDEEIPQNSNDAQLQLLLASAKLELNQRAKLIFTLKSVCGFGVNEIANSLLLTEENIYKNVQRAKKKLRQLPKNYFQNLTKADFSAEDISYIELILYFMFNEGYDSVSNSSKNAINKEICFEALRLAHLLKEVTEEESTSHLLALFYFHMARFDSRIDSEGDFVSLRNQNREKWDRSLIKIGFDCLVKPKELNRFYLEALISSLHLQASTFSQTDWAAILKLYNMLLKVHDTPVVRLNHAICLFELGRTSEALKDLENLKPVLEDTYLYYTVSMAEYLEDKDIELSKFWYQKSLENTSQEFRKQIINGKLNKLSQPN